MTQRLQLVNCFFLLVLAVFDLREKKVPGILCAAGMAGGLILHALLGGSAGLLGALAGIGIWIPFFVIGILRRGGIGAGDYLVLAASGSLTGLPAVMETAFFGFALAAGYAAVLLLRKKAGKKDTFPFVPFLFLAQVLILLPQFRI